MSYDVYLEIDTGGPESVTVFDRNHTSNTAQMWRDAGIDIADFDGRSAADFGLALNSALVLMISNPAKYRVHEPENRWGTYETTVKFLEDLLEGCKAHPSTTVRVSR